MQTINMSTVSYRKASQPDDVFVGYHQLTFEVDNAATFVWTNPVKVIMIPFDLIQKITSIEKEV